jgi:CheY-like chemotaxis protein
VILLDLFMDEMDGRAFLNTLRANHVDDPISQIPIIVTTAAGQVLSGDLPAVNAWVRKPIELDELLLTLKTFA